MFRLSMVRNAIHDMIASLHYDEKMIAKHINRYNANIINNYGSTPLHYACISQRETVVRRLIEVGADIDARDKSGRTPLMIACKNCKLEIVDILLDNGANVHLEDDKGNTAVLVACHRQLENEGHFTENEQIVERLLEKGAILDLE